MASWGKTDFKQLKKLQEKLERLEKVDFDAFCQAAAKELAARLLGKVIPRTPVGRKPTIAQLGGISKTVKMKVRGSSSVVITDPETRAFKIKHGQLRNRSFLSREGAILQRYWAGYVGGELRRGWTARTEGEAKAGSNQDPVAYAQSLPITKNGDEYTIEIINPVGYASYVEYGHRQKPGRYVPQIGKRLKAGWVKGRFMLTISEMELKAQAPAILRKKLAATLGEVFNG